MGFPLTDTCIFRRLKAPISAACQFLAAADSQILAINPQRLELGTQPGQTARSTVPDNDTKYETQIQLRKRNSERRAKSLCNSPASCVICKPVKGFASTPNIWATPLYSASVQLVDTSCSAKVLTSDAGTAQKDWRTYQTLHISLALHNSLSTVMGSPLN